MNTPMQETIPRRVTYADNAATLALQWSPTPQAGEKATEQVVGATYQIANAAGAGNNLRLILKKKIKNEKGEDQSDETTNIDGNVVGTLKGLIDAINAVDGFTAWALHAPHDHSVDSSDFINVAETALPRGGFKVTETLKRTVATANKVWLRAGLPTERDAERLDILRLQTKVTNATGAAGKLYRDRYGEDKVELRGDIAPGTSWTDHYDLDSSKPETVRGPILVEAGATNSTGLEILFTFYKVE